MKYFIIAGEASGDMHGANLMEQIKIQDPQAKFHFLGGDLMKSIGGDPVVHYKDMAFMGFINVILNLHKVIHNLKQTKSALTTFKPDVVILIDYPSFNLRIAKFVKEALAQTKVYYYISPKIWAWKSYRIKSIKKYIDKMYTIFPFETEFYQQFNYEVDYVGNPTVDSIDQFRTEEQTHPDGKLKVEENTIALLAGSRLQEIKACLPTLLKVAQNFPTYHFVIAGAPGVDQATYETLTQGKYPIVYHQTYSLVNQSVAAIVNSGTATLETALLRTPQVVIYHITGGAIINWIKDYVLHIKYVSLVNILANKSLVKELVAKDFTVKKVGTELENILHKPRHKTMILRGYDDIIRKLGEPGTARHAAEHIVKSLS